MNKKARVINVMERTAEVERKTKETSIRIVLKLIGNGNNEISTGIPFFDHMLTLFTVHGFFDLSIDATGDIDVDFHHTVEDVGLVLGDAFDSALGDRKGIKRFGHAVTPMDDALASVAIVLVYNVPTIPTSERHAFTSLTKEFLRAFSNRCGMNLHVNVFYGDNEHHINESIFKAVGRALGQAASFDDRIRDVRSSKGVL
jgi:imidazoleglycerol-phosphate dehydratase